MKLWVLDKITDLKRYDIGASDRILNFTYREVKHPNILDLSLQYNDLRKSVREKYVGYIAELGKKTINGKALKELFTIEDASLWWFSRITYKDSFQDSLFDDICKAIFIKRIMGDNKIDRLEILSDSPWLACLLGKRKISRLFIILKRLLSRVKLAMLYVSVKFALSGKRPPPEARNVKTLFLSFYPTGWNKDRAGRFSDRFFRSLSDNSEDSGYLIFLTHFCSIPENLARPVFYIQKSVRYREILSAFLDLRNAFKYLFLRNELRKSFVFEGVDLWPVYDFYLWESVILEDEYYRLMIKGVKKLMEMVGPKQVVTSAEFGASPRAVIIGARAKNIPVVWVQHAIISKTKLFFFYDASEILDEAARINTDFIRYMPIADRYMMWGEKSVETMRGYGYPEDRMFVLGNPRYDYFAEIKNKQKNEDKTVIFTPSITLEETFAFSELAIKTKERFPKKKVFIKFHPRYKELLRYSSFAEVFSLLEKRGVGIISESIETHYSASPIFVCSSSTVGIEAAYFGAKVIAYIPKYHDCHTPDWLEEGSYVYTLEELAEKIGNPAKISLLNWGGYYMPPGDAERRMSEFLRKDPTWA